MSFLVAIGGGDVGSGETLAIDEELVRAAGRSKPTALFVPTASGDAEDYVERITLTYGSVLGCVVEVVRLTQGPDDWEAKLARADLVYVGGGNTRRMLVRWRELGFDTALRARFLGGLPMGGLSAGANCWFRGCSTDSDIIDGLPGATTRYLDCLDWFPLILCPHYDSELNRRPEFPGILEGRSEPGVALDDCAALMISDERYRIATSRPGAGAYRLVGGVETSIESSDWRPLAELQA